MEPNPTGGTLVKCSGPFFAERKNLNDNDRLNKKRIVLVDDHPLVLEWLTNLIHQQSDLTVCSETENAPTALSAVAATET